MAYTLRLELNVRTRTAMSLYRNVPEPFRHAYRRLFHLVRLQENNWSWRVRDNQFRPRSRIFWQIELCGCGSALFPYSPYGDRRIVYVLLQSHTPSRCLHNAVKVQNVGFGALLDLRRRAGDQRRRGSESALPESGLEFARTDRKS